MTAEEATRRVLLVVNPRSDEARAVLATVVRQLASADVEVVLADEDRDHLAAYGDTGLSPGIVAVASDENAADGADVVVVLGGDGTVLRAAERARASTTGASAAARACGGGGGGGRGEGGGSQRVSPVLRSV